MKRTHRTAVLLVAFLLAGSAWLAAREPPRLERDDWTHWSEIQKQVRQYLPVSQFNRFSRVGPRGDFSIQLVSRPSESSPTFRFRVDRYANANLFRFDQASVDPKNPVMDSWEGRYHPGTKEIWFASPREDGSPPVFLPGSEFKVAARPDS